MNIVYKTFINCLFVLNNTDLFWEPKTHILKQNRNQKGNWPKVLKSSGAGKNKFGMQCLFLD